MKKQLKLSNFNCYNKTANLKGWEKIWGSKIG